MLLSNENIYYKSSYCRLTNGDLETEVVLNPKDNQKSLEQVQSSGIIYGPIQLTTHPEKFLGLIRPIGALCFFLRNRSEGWELYQKITAFVDDEKSPFVVAEGKEEQLSIGLPLEKALEALSIIFDAIKPNKDQIANLPPSQSSAAVLAKDLPDAMKAFEKAGISLPFTLDLSESFLPNGPG